MDFSRSKENTNLAYKGIKWILENDWISSNHLQLANNSQYIVWSALSSICENGQIKKNVENQF